MRIITEFTPALAQHLPHTTALLREGHLVLHPFVTRVILSGSRGIGGTPRPDSDIDLSLVIAHGVLPAGEPERAQTLEQVLRTTLDSWRGSVECDLAAVFDQRGCGLACLSGRQSAPPDCPQGGACRFGIYKIQKGFRGYIDWEGIELRRMYPILEIVHVQAAADA